MDSGRSMRAVKNTLHTPSGEVVESEGFRLGAHTSEWARCSRENTICSSFLGSILAVGQMLFVRSWRVYQ